MIKVKEWFQNLKKEQRIIIVVTAILVLLTCGVAAVNAITNDSDTTNLAVEANNKNKETEFEKQEESSKLEKVLEKKDEVEAKGEELKESIEDETEKIEEETTEEPDADVKDEPTNKNESKTATASLGKNKSSSNNKSTMQKNNSSSQTSKPSVKTNTNSSKKKEESAKQPKREQPKQEPPKKDEPKSNPYLVTNPSSSAIEQKYDSHFGSFSHVYDIPSNIVSQIESITQRYADGSLSKSSFEDEIKSLTWQHNNSEWSVWLVESIRFTTSSLDVSEIQEQIANNGGQLINGHMRTVKFNYSNSTTTVVVVGVHLMETPL